MKRYSNVFLILALITGLIGFTGLNFDGIMIPRILFVLFTDLFLVSLMAKALFAEEEKMKYEKVSK